MALLRTNILFPTQFEEAYNKLHKGMRYTGGSDVSPNVYPAIEEKHRLDAKNEERQVALKRSIANPRSRLYPSITARGGDIQSPEARRLLPKLLSKRVDDYRRISQTELPVKSEEGVEAKQVSSSRQLAEELDMLFNSLLTTLSVGNISKDILELATNVMRLLLSQGYKLNARQLEHLYAYMPDLLEYAGRRIRIAGREGQIGRPAEVPEEMKRITQNSDVLLNTIGRILRALISKADAPEKARQLFQRSIRVEASKFLRDKVKQLTPTRPLRKGPEEELERYGFVLPRLMKED